MSEQDSTVKVDGYAYADITPKITRLEANGYSTDRTALTFGNENMTIGSIALPNASWVQVIPMLIEALPEPFRAQARAAVIAQLDVVAVNA